MVTYTVVYEIIPNEPYTSQEAFENAIKPAIDIIGVLSASFGSLSPKVEYPDKNTQKACITVSIQAGKQKLFAIYDLFNIIGDYLSYYMGDTLVRVGRSYK